MLQDKQTSLRMIRSCFPTLHLEIVSFAQLVQRSVVKVHLRKVLCSHTEYGMLLIRIRSGFLKLI